MAIEAAKERQIFEAATGLFARFGFKKTSIDQIAGEAGVGKGTVYLVAKSKADLFYKVVNRALRDYTADVSKHVDPRIPADQLLVRCSFAAHQYLEDRPLVRDLLLGHHAETLPMWADQLADLRGVGRQHIVEILHIGIRQGRFRTDLDVDKLSRILQDMQSMGLLVAHKEKRSLEEQLDYGGLALDVLLRGLVKR